MFGSSSARSLKTSWAAAQSRPITATRSPVVIRGLPHVSMVTKRSPAPSPRLRTQSYQWSEGPPKLPDWSTVKLLRRVLHWGAAASAASGVGLTLFPSLIVHRFFEQNHAN